ncbi:MAG: DUF2851 family protein, partial [Gemmatimonadota bacterium]|nr:DUF2851 family protein [Gemmatimonadota bacterium]
AEQTLYEYAMRAAGYTKNTDACQSLARRLPLATIRALIGTGGGHRIIDLQALLFGAAGLLPSQRLSYGGEIQDEPYVREIETRWEAFRPSIPARPMREHDWLFFRLRPFNFPTVRLAAMSYFIASGLRDGLDTLIAGPMTAGADRGSVALLRHTARKLEAMIRPSPGDYWLRHTVFGETSRTARKALIGRDRQRGMMVDVVLPFIYALADRDSQSDRMNLVREMYTGYGRQANNSVIQAMSNLLFIDTPEKKASIDRAVLQQGLLQIDLETCRNKDCGQCVMSGSTHFTRS